MEDAHFSFHLTAPVKHSVHRRVDSLPPWQSQTFHLSFQVISDAVFSWAFDMKLNTECSTSYIYDSLLMQVCSLCFSFPVKTFSDFKHHFAWSFHNTLRLRQRILYKYKNVYRYCSHLQTSWSDGNSIQQFESKWNVNWFHFDTDAEILILGGKKISLLGFIIMLLDEC